MGMTSRRTFILGLTVALTILIGVSAASAETLLMPDRDFLMSPTSEVVWGTTTLPNTTSTYTFHFDDGSADATGTVTDGSYIAVNHAFVASGTLHATLTVVNGATTEVANVTLQVFNPALLTADALRGLNINRAIQDGLRYLWQSQSGRAANFPANIMTNWGGAHPAVWTALIVAAFENHGYSLPNNANPATGVYQKYVVERGMNFLGNSLTAFTTTQQGTALNEPCAGLDTAGNPIVGPSCTALFLNDNPGYATSIAIQPLSASSALSRRFPASGVSANVADKSYGEILQRLVIGLAYGQGDDIYINGRGGWYYTFNSSVTDGSTIGWNMVALLDAQAAGVVIPAFVQSEFKNYAFPRSMNADGTFDYNEDGNPASPVYPNATRAGVALQAMFYAGDNTLLSASTSAITNRWAGNVLSGDYGSTCQSYINLGTNAGQNKGCAYAMYNIFKGLKLQGVTTLPGIGRPAGPGTIPADDWYADYQDWLVTNQNAPTTIAGGGWAYTGNNASSLVFSCCASPESAPDTALAELILSPVALVLPDPTLFGTVGLGPATSTNPVNTNHTVTALVQAPNHSPIAGATVGFTIVSGPNAGAAGTCLQPGCVSDANGQVAFTYFDANGAGTDTIRANIGALQSNTVTKNWVVVVKRCDADGDGDIDNADLLIIRNANLQVSSGPSDPRDGNGDGVINVADVRYCQLRLGQ